MKGALQARQRRILGATCKRVSRWPEASPVPAGHLHAVGGVLKHRDLGATLRIGMGAAGMHRAPWGWRQRAGHIAAELFALSGAGVQSGHGPRHGSEQGATVRMAWRIEHLSGRTGLDDAAEVHHPHLARDATHHRQVMRDEDIAETQTMLGEKQEAWLAEELASSGRWSFIAQQTVVSSINGAAAFADPSAIALIKDGLFNYDAWDGSWVARERLVKAIKDGQVRNPIVLTGDFHTNLAFDLLESWPDPRKAKTPVQMSSDVKNWKGKKLGTEICAGAISSPTFFGDGLLSVAAPGVRANTPWIRYADFKYNGYVLLTIQGNQTQADYRVANALVKPSVADGKPRRDKRIIVTDGVPGISKVV